MTIVFGNVIVTVTANYVHTRVVTPHYTKEKVMEFPGAVKGVNNFALRMTKTLGAYFGR